MHQWVLDVEVVWVMEDGDLLVAGCSWLLTGLVVALWRDWDGGKVNLRLLLQVAIWGLNCGGHVDCVCGCVDNIG